MLGNQSTPTGSPIRTKLVWSPQAGPQKALVDCPFPEIFFGGARGGGKTDGVLGKWAIKERRYGSNFNGIMFRRTTVSAEDAIERSRQIYEPLGAQFNAQKHIWRMPNGGRVAFSYLERVKDAEEYQGRNVTDAWVEEAGQFPDPAPIDTLNGVLRSASGVPTQLILTANPGGAGQHWLRERYKLFPFPSKPLVITRTLPSGATWRYAVIPSRLTDNKILLNSDPTYQIRLQMVGSAELVRAWLEGDWSAVQGAFFDGWSEKRHAVEPFYIPEQWMKFRAMDWGFAKPSSVGWWAMVSDDRQLPDGRVLPRGCMVRYREFYSASAPNVGMRLDAEEMARRIVAMSKNEKYSYSVADPAMFAEDGGPSLSERMSREKVILTRADNSRVSKAGAMGGWDQMRSRLRGVDEKRPMIVTFSTCTDSIRTIPVLQHDPSRAEDLDTEAEDHAADEWRYACMSRPWAKSAEANKPKDSWRSAFNRRENSNVDWKTA